MSNKAQYNKNLVCTIKELLIEQKVKAALQAVEINPINAIIDNSDIFKERSNPIKLMEKVNKLKKDFNDDLKASELSIKVKKYWGITGVNLTVQFIDKPIQPEELRNRILMYMNVWGRYGNINFKEVLSNGKVRVSLESKDITTYVGTDILQVSICEPTTCLGGINSTTSEVQVCSILLHVTGHLLGLNYKIPFLEKENALNKNIEISKPNSILKNDDHYIINDRVSKMDRNFISKLYPKDFHPYYKK